jgi:prepilin-type N-terminal cleavage/methylation domain-containing protein
MMRVRGLGAVRKRCELVTGIAMKTTSRLSANYKNDAGFTLTDLMVCLAIISILTIIAVPIHLDSVEKAKAAEAKVALAEVVRLEQLHYANKGSYASNLQELGFNIFSPLKYTQVFVQVRQDAQGWSYVAMAVPLDAQAADADLWAVARSAGGQGPAATGMPTALKGGGGSACSFWSGWGSMEGGRIEGEETISSWSSSTGNGGSPCGGKRAVDHGRK